MSTLSDLQAIGVLPKVCYHSPLLNNSGTAAGSELMLADSTNRSIMTEFYRITGSMAFHLNDGVQGSLTTILGLGSGSSAKLGLFYSAYRRMASNSRRASYSGTDYTGDLSDLDTSISNLVSWLGSAGYSLANVTFILVDMENFDITLDATADIIAKADAVYAKLIAAFSSAKIVWYNKSAATYTNSITNAKYTVEGMFPKSYSKGYNSCAMYSPQEVDSMHELYRLSVRESARRRQQYVIPLVSLAFHYERPTASLGSPDYAAPELSYAAYPTQNSYHFGKAIFNSTVAQQPNRYAPYDRAPFAFIWYAWAPSATTTGSTFADHFKQFATGGTS